ncbi:MAG: MurR/RpiR family transcriptional regulator [Acidobacteriaceae bacterium]
MKTILAKSALQKRNGEARKEFRTSLEQRFAGASEGLGRSRRDLIRAILDNPDDTYFLSSRAMAKRYGVDTATIVRTVQALGYARYADFITDLRTHFVSRLTPYTLMKAAASEKRSIADHIAHSLETELQNLHVLRSTLRSPEVIEIAKIIDRASRIVIVGIDLAYSLSTHLAYGLVSVGYDAEAPLGSTGNLHQKINVLGARDVLVAISFGRCLRDTVESAQRARERGAFTFGMTDSSTSPIAQFCDAAWITSIANPSFLGSYVAPIAAMDALIVACAHLQPKRSLEMLQYKDSELRSGARWYSAATSGEYNQNFSKENDHAAIQQTKTRT